MNFIVALIPAHNEEESIRATIGGLLDQRRQPDRIVVIPNGCKDETAAIANRYPVDVFELPKLEHKKSQALNMAWNAYGQDADLVICLDADTVLPPNAIGDWEDEFFSKPHTKDSHRRATKPLGGSSSKFTMRGDDFLTRLQRAEFARWTDTALSRGWTTVLAGTGCAISGEALRRVVDTTDRYGPWSYDSQVEDFELTYRIREMGYQCQVSRTVRAYTDSMKTVRALWGQRMKWQVGTVEDLLALGVNRLTIVDWWQQTCGLFMAFMRALWAIVLLGQICLGVLTFQWLWMVAVPIGFMATEFYAALRIPHRDRMDVVFALAIIPSETFAWLRAGWFVAAWVEVLLGKVTGKRKDRWQAQYAAEAGGASLKS